MSKERIFARKIKTMKENNTVKYRGELDLNGLKIPCYVLNDGTRVLSGRGLQEALKMVDTEEGKQTAGTRLSRYLSQKSLKPFVDKYIGPLFALKLL